MPRMLMAMMISATDVMSTRRAAPVVTDGQ
jgi:hypothetical protein